MAEQSLSIAFRYTADEYVEGLRFGEASFTPAKLRLSWVGHATLAIGGVVCGPMIIFANPGDRFAMVLGSAVLGLGIWCVYGLIVRIWRYTLGIRRGFKKLDLLRGQWEMEFSEVGLKVSGPLASSDTSWQALKGFVETPNLYVLSLGAGYIIVPKRTLLPAQLASFSKLIRKKLAAVNPRYGQRDFVIALAVGVAVLLLLYAALRFFAGR